MNNHSALSGVWLPAKRLSGLLSIRKETGAKHLKCMTFLDVP